MSVCQPRSPYRTSIHEAFWVLNFGVLILILALWVVHDLEIVRLGIPRLGTWRKQTQGFYGKTLWPPMALRIGLLESSALQNYGLDAHVILQCRTPQETNPKGQWGPTYFFINSLFLLPPCTQSWYTQPYDL